MFFALGEGFHGVPLARMEGISLSCLFPYGYALQEMRSGEDRKCASRPSLRRRQSSRLPAADVFALPPAKARSKECSQVRFGTNRSNGGAQRTFVWRLPKVRQGGLPPLPQNSSGASDVSGPHGPLPGLPNPVPSAKACPFTSLATRLRPPRSEESQAS